MDNELEHIGTPRKSGRYPWGSGENPNQRNISWLGNIRRLEEQGLSELEIAKGQNLSIKKLRQKKTIEKIAEDQANAAMALRLHNKGWSNVAIGKRMGRNESSIRDMLKPAFQERAKILENVSNALRDAADKNKYVDVGLGEELRLGISGTKLGVAVAMLEREGYHRYPIDVPQGISGKKTRMLVLCAPDVTYSDMVKNQDKIKMVTEHYSEDGGRTITTIKPPVNISSDRVSIRYGEDGGKDKDGVIELRRGVEDISLDKARYSQVRIGVDGTHYMKGMAIYSDDIPSGFDIIYNTNKEKGTPKEKVFKTNENDPDNPFGSVIRQKEYIGSDGEKHLSALNIVNEEGDPHSWNTWSKTLSSQILSKQSKFLAKKQLTLDYDSRVDEFNTLTTLTNPAVKKRLIDSFADDCDSAAVHLKAAALPGQASHVILPVMSLKENEVYAPNYNNGEVLVLIRHPHGGTFEIPQLVNNKKNAEAKKMIEDSNSAIGINPKVASQLSGADFDGDVVIVIPNKNRDIRTSSPLKGLKDFNAREMYPYYDGMPVMTKHMKEQKMGDVSNLITDMTIKGANPDEICRAVKHSMVVIDAEKHKLNYKQSYIDNNIAALKKRYQGRENAGASTLISKAASEYRVDERKDRGTKTTLLNTDPITGKKIYRLTGETYVVNIPDKKGPSRINPKTGKIEYLVTKGQKIVKRQTKSTKMAEEEDAFNLSSGTRMEEVYANYANSLKALANRARLTSLKIKNIVHSPSASETYSKEVESLNAKLNIATRHKPLERQARLLANKNIAVKRQANPLMDRNDLKKLGGLEIVKARARFGGGKEKIVITDREWDAIQAGAITHSKLSNILLNMDVKTLRERALPHTHTQMSASKINRAREMASRGYTRVEIANNLGVSISTLEKELNKKGG